MFPYIIAGAIGFVVAKLFEDDKTPKYADGGSVLLAPNGKPSNLTPEQYKLVRSKAFKKWFGDWENDPANASKVVDENVEPLIVYHGSNVDFNIFEKSKTNPYAEKQGYFFSFDKKYAESYNSKYVKPFFINIRIKGTFDDDDNLVPFNADGNIVQGLQVEVYDKKNIKLADGTNKTFDSSNPDIRFEEGGITITDEFSTESYDFGNVGNSIKKNNLEVGQIQYDINKEKGIVSIYLLEVLEKGIGAKVINYFFNNGINIIYGDAVDSIEFWDKMGAKFDEFNEDINGYPFTISKEDFVKTKYYENTNPDIRFKRGGRTL